MQWDWEQSHQQCRREGQATGRIRKNGFPAAASSLPPVRSLSDIHSAMGTDSPKMPTLAYAFVRKSTLPNCHLTTRNVLRKSQTDCRPPSDLAALLLKQSS